MKNNLPTIIFTDLEENTCGLNNEVNVDRHISGDLNVNVREIINIQVTRKEDDPTHTASRVGVGKYNKHSQQILTIQSIGGNNLQILAPIKTVCFICEIIINKNERF